MIYVASFVLGANPVACSTLVIFIFSFVMLLDFQTLLA